MQNEDNASIFVADSFLMRLADAPLAVDFPAHMRRFGDSVLRVAGDILKTRDSQKGFERERIDEELRNFLATVPKKLAEAKQTSFPRIEAKISPSAIDYSVLLRRAPALKTTHSFLGAQANTALLQNVKGPNISSYASLVASRGGEILLTNAEGMVLETTTSSVVWWEGETLNFVADTKNRVSSVTEKVVLQIAKRLGIATVSSSISAAALPEFPVWSLNALHGIRPVTYISKTAVPVSKKESSLMKFQEEYRTEFRALEA